jgi:hypothetical protein
MPSGYLSSSILDTMPGGGWICIALDSSSTMTPLSTIDSGKTWKPIDLSVPGSISKWMSGLTDGWTQSIAIVSDTLKHFVRHGSLGAWTCLPPILGARRNLIFADGDRIYGTGDSGLVYMEMDGLGVADRSANKAGTPSWHREGTNLVVTGIGSARRWELCSLSGEQLAYGRTAGTTSLSIPLGSIRGAFLVRLQAGDGQTGFAFEAIR